MLIVQKYGGTSVGDLDRIAHVARRVQATKEAGNQVVVVVSAMSGETNKLVDYASHFSASPSKREMDLLLSSGERVTSALLAIALQESGNPARALTGRQAGIITDSFHTFARIDRIETEKIKAHLDSGEIVVVAGFQGVNEQGQVTTLGRGGSDLSAVALAGALRADCCEIYTDVDGVFTTDPRIEPKAKKIDAISYDEMLELASLGAKVLQNRSVEMAKKLDVNLVTRNTFNDNPGTLITKEEEIMEKPIVSGIALDKNQAQVSIVNIDDRPGIAAEFFVMLADQNINVDMIVQNVSHEDKANIDFTIPQSEINAVQEALKNYPMEMGAIEYNDSIAKVSIVGVGMKSHTGVAAKAFQTMAKENINIMMISTSEIKISMVVENKYAELAVRALHEAYELDK